MHRISRVSFIGLSSEDNIKEVYSPIPNSLVILILMVPNHVICCKNDQFLSWTPTLSYDGACSFRH